MKKEHALCHSSAIEEGQSKGIAIDLKACKACQLQGPARVVTTPGFTSTLNAIGKSLGNKIKDVMPCTLENLVPADSACLLCGTPSCEEHSSAKLLEEKITVCTDCCTLVNYNDADNTSGCLPQYDQDMVNKMLDCYDRALIQLRYVTYNDIDLLQPLTQWLPLVSGMVVLKYADIVENTSSALSCHNCTVG